MRRLLFFGAVILSMIGGLRPSAIGQSITYMTSLPPQYSIVREYQDSVYIVYGYDGINKKHLFWYVDRVNNINRLAEVTVPIYQLQIKDMRISGQYLFICGKVGPWATAGCMDINDVFIAGVSSPMTLMYVNDSNIIRFNRMDIVDVGGDNMHLLMVGESYSTQYDVPSRCVADLLFHCPNRTVVDFRYTQEPSGIYYYDDIKVTANTVVVAGHKNGSNAQYMHSYPKPSTPTDFIFNIGTNTNTIFYVGGVQHRPVCDVRLEHIGGDNIATLYYSRRIVGTDTVYGLSLNVFYSINNLVYQGFIQLDTTTPSLWRLKEVCYASRHNELYVLQHTIPFGKMYGMYPLKDYLYRFSLNSFPSPVGVYDVSAILPTVTSMGRTRTGDAVALSGGSLRLSRFTGTNNGSCASIFYAPMINEYLGLNKFDYVYDVHTTIVNNPQNNPVLYNINSTIICAE